MTDKIEYIVGTPNSSQNISASVYRLQTVNGTQEVQLLDSKGGWMRIRSSAARRLNTSGPKFQSLQEAVEFAVAACELAYESQLQQLGVRRIKAISKLVEIL